jgi:uncharacterized protein YndB with AHSA1/START domain
VPDKLPTTTWSQTELSAGGQVRCRQPHYERAGYEGTQLVEVDFTEHPDATTTVVLTNTGLRDDKSRRDHEEGWQASFNNLDLVLASHR